MPYATVGIRTNQPGTRGPKHAEGPTADGKWGVWSVLTWDEWKVGASWQDYGTMASKPGKETAVTEEKEYGRRIFLRRNGLT